MNEIKQKYEMIALEAMGHALPITIGSPTFLKVKGIAKAIAEWARNRIRPETRIIAIAFGKHIKTLDNANIADINDVKITIPRGLNGYLNAYVEALFDSYVTVENIHQDVLVPFSTWLNLMLANPEYLKDAASIRDLKNYKTPDVEKARDLLSKFVNPNSRQETGYVKSVYPSISVMRTTWENINALATRYLESNPTKVLKLVSEISNNINRLVNIVEEREGSFSGNAATTAAKLVADMAAAVDLYGQLGILIRECAVVGSRNVIELEKHLVASAKSQRTLAMESLGLPEDTFRVGTRNVERSSLVDVILYHGRSVNVPVKDFQWLVDEGVVSAHVEESGWDKGHVIGIEYEDGVIMPIENSNIVGATIAAGHASVPCLVLTVGEVAETLDRINGVQQN